MKLRNESASLALVLLASSAIQCGGISQRDLGSDGAGPGDESGASASGSGAGTGSSSGSGTTGSGATGSGSTGSGAPGSGGNDGMGSGGSAIGSGGSSDPGAGGATSVGGTTGTGGGVAWDPNCYPPNAKVGAACTQDCDTECGLAAMGNRHCTCYNGTYVDCSCPRPPEYLGAPTAPYCAYGNGLTPSIKGTACSVEWEQCIALDPVTGVTPRGCVCLPNELGGNLLTWFCGSTNRWFELAE